MAGDDLATPDDACIPGHTYGHHPAAEVGEVDGLDKNNNGHVLVERVGVVIGVGLGFSLDPEVKRNK